VEIETTVKRPKFRPLITPQSVMLNKQCAARVVEGRFLKETRERTDVLTSIVKGQGESGSHASPSEGIT